MQELQRLDAEQWLPAPVIAERSRERLTATLRHACGHVPYYKEWCAEAGLDPARVSAEDLRSFPLVTKHHLMDRQERFLADDSLPADRVPWATGGSSGIWFKFQIDRRSFDVRSANALRATAWAGWKLGDRQAVLWGHLEDNKITHSRRGRFMASVVHRSLNLNVYDVNDAVLADYAQRLRAWRPTLIRGYTRSLAFFADYFVAQGLEMRPPCGIISAAETLFDDQRARIENCFGCRVYNRYGSREFADIAQQCEEVGGLHIFSDRMHLEILRPDGRPCDPGERGEIVITDLENRVMPFIRYRIGDLARSQEGACACGRGLPLLAAVEGRTTELIVSKNGKYYPYPGPALFGANTPGVAQMQMFQKNRDEIEIRIVPNQAWVDDSARQVTARIHELLGAVDVQIRMMERIPPLASGKTPFVISTVVPDTSWESDANS
jgi:phenylacetate-CoA ligase